MSTIAQPRESSVNGRRVPGQSTPTSSSRPSLDNIRSSESSPSRGPPSFPQPARRNRAALREYYNLKKNEASNHIPDDNSSVSSFHGDSEVLESPLDLSDFNAERYVKEVLATQNLGELLRTYNGILTDIRALDAEKKALVYDNYSKLIKATETIRKMRSNMDPLNPMASTLDLAIGGIYERAEKIREELRGEIPESVRRELENGGRERRERRDRVRGVIGKVLDMPERLRALVKEGRGGEGRKEWEVTLRVLERWRERGVGGEDVQDCIDDGEAALRGEPPNENSWVNVKKARLAES